MAAKIELLSVIALEKGISARGLRKGRQGTIVEFLKDGHYEVEFSDRRGRTKALVPLSAEDFSVVWTPSCNFVQRPKQSGPASKRAAAVRARSASGVGIAASQSRLESAPKGK
ncbi:MAG: DUF4926 domain-containing protein [bacterium]|jgi:hypothetical protein